jgi:hypothetical protein
LILEEALGKVARENCFVHIFVSVFRLVKTLKSEQRLLVENIFITKITVCSKNVRQRKFRYLRKKGSILFS